MEVSEKRQRNVSFRKQLCGWSIVLLLLGHGSCTKPTKNDLPPEPQLEFLSRTPDRVNIFDSTGMITVRFHFTDGDGNIGDDPAEQRMGIFIRDSRDTSEADFTFAFPFPYIPDDLRPDDRSLDAALTLKLGRQYFPPRDSLHAALKHDTMTWFFYIMDADSNKSNIVQSDTIYVDYEL